MAFPDTPFPEAHFCTSESKGSDQKTNNRPVSGARCPRWATVGSVVSHPDGPRSPGDRRGPCRRAGWPYHGRASDDGTRKGYKPDIFPPKATTTITAFRPQNHCFTLYTTESRLPICGHGRHPSFVFHRQLTPCNDAPKGGTLRAPPGTGWPRSKRITAKKQ